MAVRRRSIGASKHRRKARPIILLILLAAVTITVLDRSTENGPVDAITDYLRDGFASVGELSPFSDDESALETENQRLRDQLAEAEGRLAQTADAERERKNLAELLGLSTADSVPRVVARVTSLGASNFEASVELGKGSDAGIAVGNPVVSGRGLVGRVVETSSQRSMVLLVGDTTSNVVVRFSNAGDIGVATGQGMNKPARVDLIDLDSRVQTGEVAVTSGLQNSLFPPGIPVGTVTASNAGPQDLRRAVELEPLVKATSLDTVAVLQWGAAK